jgi:hypothetical protein
MVCRLGWGFMRQLVFAPPFVELNISGPRRVLSKSTENTIAYNDF